MAIPKKIVDTRKLNKNNKARLGRGGDTELREVDNKESHVNAFEAYLIDVNGKAGEEYVKRVGAGTINPLTGIPEYRGRTRSSGSTYADSGHGASSWYGGSPDPDNPYSYENLSNVTASQLSGFDPDLGSEDVKYFQDIFSDVPFHFLEDQQTLTTGRALDVKEFEGRGLQSQYGATMGALGSQEKMFGIQGEGLTAQQAALGRTTGRSLSQAAGATSVAASRSGLARSGAVTQAYETQKKDLFQDYRAGTQDIGRQRAGIGVGMEDIERQRGAALETLNLGMDQAGADYTYTTSGARLDFAKGMYGEQQKQMDEYWQMIGLRQSA